MNRCEQILAMTSEQRYRLRVRTAYKIHRRRGHARGAEALARAEATVARLTAAHAIMEASDWKADALRVVRNLRT